MREGRKGWEDGGRKKSREERREEGKRKGGERGTYFWHLWVTHVFVDDHALHQCSFF